MNNQMDNNEYKRELSKKLVDIFGKNTFTKDELTKEFYVDLYIGCADFFKTDGGTVDLDLFWSNGFKEWLLMSK